MLADWKIARRADVLEKPQTIPSNISNGSSSICAKMFASNTARRPKQYMDDDIDVDKSTCGMLSHAEQWNFDGTV